VAARLRRAGGTSAEASPRSHVSGSGGRGPSEGGRGDVGRAGWCGSGRGPGEGGRGDVAGACWCGGGGGEDETPHGTTGDRLETGTCVALCI
jgi:hypothetical protein